MKKQKLYLLSALTVLLLAGSACTVEEGKGGTATISGTLILKQYNDDMSVVIDSTAALAEDIYIRYGSSMAAADRERTSNTGYFEFPYLFEGDYTIYYFTEELTENGVQQVEREVNVNVAKGATKDLGTLIQTKILEWDDGYASITGRVREILYFSYPHAKDTIPAQEKEVYLRYNNGLSYVERIRTDYNGYFEFPNLLPGEYEVYVYGENYIDTPEKVVVSKSAAVSSLQDTTISLGEFFIDNF